MVTELQFVAVAAFLIWGLVGSLCGVLTAAPDTAGPGFRRDRGVKPENPTPSTDIAHATGPRIDPSLETRETSAIEAERRAAVDSIAGSDVPAWAAGPGAPPVANGWTYRCRNVDARHSVRVHGWDGKPHAHRNDARSIPSIQGL